MSKPSYMLARLTDYFRMRGDTLSLDCIKWHMGGYVDHVNMMNYGILDKALNAFSPADKVTIFGAGKGGSLAMRLLKERNVSVTSFIDNNKEHTPPRGCPYCLWMNISKAGKTPEF